ncbi:hypothetical protein [Pseudomonas syringae]|uniref:hypothetical protein n=1 Tax=Pseudomonas syringae TaxID=317 RepID=UPI000CDB1CD3|nr:hypothetical protein [Pseudomonas syringae]POR63323.1 hypothetical protein BKM10_19470 [Pseudomonas syringae pv. syringae]
MAVTLKKSHLQTNVYIYIYIWTRYDDDQPYACLEDRRQVDKDEGYEVLYFLGKLLNKHDKETLPDVHAA